MTKFDGNFANWLPFWNTFQAEVDKSDVPPVTKFAYLKGWLEPKVRAEIEGLPFTTEGYQRAKNVLESEYGKTSEIVNTHVQNIMGLVVLACQIGIKSTNCVDPTRRPRGATNK